MCMAVEMNGKGGAVCPRSYRGGNGCPLIVRPTSEDVLVGNVFGILRRLRPALWLRPMLNAAFSTRRFTTCSVRGLDVAFWKRMAPPSVRMGIEDWSEPDLTIRFDDTVVLLEAKYRSGLATRTTRDPSRDQVARLLDVAFHEAVAEQFFARSPFVLVLGVPQEEPALVTRYRSRSALAEALTHHRKFPGFERMVSLLATRVGYVSWRGLSSILAKTAAGARPVERSFLGDVVEYISHKTRQAELSVDELRNLTFPRLEQPEQP